MSPQRVIGLRILLAVEFRPVLVSVVFRSLYNSRDCFQSFRVTLILASLSMASAVPAQGKTDPRVAEVLPARANQIAAARGASPRAPFQRQIIEVCVSEIVVFLWRVSGFVLASMTE